MKHIILSLLALTITACVSSSSTGTPAPITYINPVVPSTERWVVYYTDKLPASAFSDYDLIAFDSDHHPDLLPLKAQGKILLGYISLAEAETYRSYYKKIKDKGLLLENNNLWKGHVIIDVRKEEWERMLLDELIPPILAQGFDGIMIDTIDSAIYPEIEHPEKYAGMKQGAVKLVKAIRARYPNIKIMINRGLEIADQTAPYIDYLMAESTLTDWVPDPTKPKLVDEATYQRYLEMIRQARAASPTLKIYSMDYWDMNDAQGVKSIYARQRAQGFVPYVSTMDLQHLHDEPK
ncbi:MAG: endo alpha-1,4 polygalactosaminidase [Rickettsiales bacterium]